MTDEALMSAVKNGDVDQAAELYDRYSKRLYNYFVKISFDRDAGDDLLQNTFIRVLKYRHTYKEGKAFKSWLFQIARNVFADHLRQTKMKVSDYTDVSEVDSKVADPLDTMSQNDKEAQLYKSMLNLNHETREILVMSKFENMKYEDIAKVLDCSIGAVKVKVHRAINKLRENYFELEQI